MARRRWSEWASARMLRALVREGARVHAAAGVHGLWHHLRAFGWRAGVQHARSRARICILRPDSARYHTPGEAETVSASRALYLFLGQVKSLTGRYKFRGRP